MKTIHKLTLLVSSAIFSLSANAHAGHDHASWSSDLLHVLFYGSITIAVVALAFGLKKYTNKKNTQESNS